MLFAQKNATYPFYWSRPRCLHSVSLLLKVVSVLSGLLPANGQPRPASKRVKLAGAIGNITFYFCHRNDFSLFCSHAISLPHIPQ